LLILISLPAAMRHFYAADLLIKLPCQAGFMRKVPEVPEYSILASGTVIGLGYSLHLY